MRLSLTLLIILICFGSIKAQPFLPIVKEGAVWDQVEGWGAAGETTYYDYEYEMIGDTMIDFLSYKKLFRLVDGDTIYNGAIREDNGRVYFLTYHDSTSYDNWCLSSFNEPWFWTDTLINFSQEVLIYDFNLTIGDTLHIYEVDWVGTITLTDGIPRKRMLLSRTQFNGNGTVVSSITWVEGIGSDQGLLEAGCPVFENGYFLNCYQDSSINYPEPCLNLTVPGLGQSQNWSISPNPASNQIKISIDVSDQLELIIRNVLGEAVLRKPITSVQVIDISEFSNGLYTASLIQEGLPLGAKKFVVSQ